MKYSIMHALTYSYDSPVRFSTQYLRLTPRDTARQTVVSWKLETPGQPMRTIDGYGNVLHVLTLDKPVSEITIFVSGRVETSPALDQPSDFTGTPLSPLLFMRPTGLTRADAELASFVEAFRRRAGTVSGLRELAAAVQKRSPGASAEELSHHFIACGRHLGLPSRYVSGYACSGGKSGDAMAIHAWAEAWLDERWRSFDVAQGTAAGEGHIKIAIGADYLDACPIRGVRTGGGKETLIARADVTVEPQQ